MPMRITSTANGIKSHEDQLLEVAVGGVAAAAGALTGSQDELAVTGGVVLAAVCVADSFLGLAAGRVG